MKKIICPKCKSDEVYLVGYIGPEKELTESETANCASCHYDWDVPKQKEENYGCKI